MSAPAPFQRESIEYQPISVEANGSAVTTNVLTSIVELGDRPTTWGTAVTIGTALGVLVDCPSLGPGTYEVYAKVLNFSPETPVVNCGTFRIV